MQNEAFLKIMDSLEDGSLKKELLRVSDGLCGDDLSHMISLCCEPGVLTKGEAGSIQSGCDLFTKLEERGKLNKEYLWYLADLLLTIGQNSLLDLIGLGHLSDEDHTKRRCQLNSYRLFLTKVAMEIGDEDFTSLKRECGCNKEEVTNFYALVRFLENHGKIGQKQGIRKLVEFLQCAGLLESKVKESVDAFEEEFESRSYRMSSKPKGICIIINNVKFARKKDWRYGSNEDASRLERLFSTFGFQVKSYRDQNSKDITKVLQEAAKLDHWRYDCFICCVLSHGRLGHVYGVDDKAVSIQTLLDLFATSNCPGLRDKPKVFFFQACQNSSGLTGDSSASSNDVSSDAVVHYAPPDTLKLEPDVLLGYATTPGYKSYRSTSDGSWYIDELVNCLKKNGETCGEKNDLLSILTMVNERVAQKHGSEDGVRVQQIPHPVFSLKKLLYLK